MLLVSSITQDATLGDATFISIGYVDERDLARSIARVIDVVSPPWIAEQKDRVTDRRNVVPGIVDAEDGEQVLVEAPVSAVRSRDCESRPVRAREDRPGEGAGRRCRRLRRARLGALVAALALARRSLCPQRV